MKMDKYAHCTLIHTEHMVSASGEWQCSVATGLFKIGPDFLSKKPKIPDKETKFKLVLCNTHDTSILIVDTYATIPVSPRS